MPYLSAAHPYEIAFFIVALVATVCSVGLFVMKVGDLWLVKASREDLATEYNTTEKVRKQGFILTITGVFLHTAMTSVNNPAPLSIQTLNLLSGYILASVLVIVDAYFTYRKRLRLPELIAKDNAHHGGRRATDTQL